MFSPIEEASDHEKRKALVAEAVRRLTAVV